MHFLERGIEATNGRCLRLIEVLTASANELEHFVNAGGVLELIRGCGHEQDCSIAAWRIVASSVAGVATMFTPHTLTCLLNTAPMGASSAGREPTRRSSSLAPAAGSDGARPGPPRERRHRFLLLFVPSGGAR